MTMNIFILLVVEYKIADMGFLRYYLAPKIEENDEWRFPFCDNNENWLDSASDITIDNIFIVSLNIVNPVIKC